jgi:hypothetical protein
VQQGATAAAPFLLCSTTEGEGGVVVVAVTSGIWGGGLTTTTTRLLVVCVPPWQRTSQLLQSIALLPRAQRLDTKRAPRDQGHCKLSLCSSLIYFLSFHNTGVCVCVCVCVFCRFAFGSPCPSCPTVFVE